MNIKMALEFLHAGIQPVDMAISDSTDDSVIELLNYAKKLMVEAEGVLTNAAKREEEDRGSTVPAA